jgi:ADP-heptose:LPS heptosyltransferase
MCLKHAHRAFPEARVGLVIASRAAMLRDLFAAYPWLEVREASRRSPAALARLFRDFWRSDVVITQYAGKPGGRFSLLSKIAGRMLAKHGGLIGFADASRLNAVLYDKVLPLLPDGAIAERDRRALRAADVPISLPFPTLIPLEQQGILQKFALAGKSFIIVHLFAGNTSRGLHPDRKRALLLALSTELPHMHWVISGGSADRAEAAHLARGLPATILAGDATLQELMHLIQHSRGVVSVDTGVAHIAAQLGGIPLMVMRTCIGRAWWLPGQYDPTAPITVFACDEKCQTGHVAKAYPECIGSIDVETVAQKLNQLLT